MQNNYQVGDVYQVAINRDNTASIIKVTPTYLWIESYVVNPRKKFKSISTHVMTYREFESLNPVLVSE